MTKAQRYNYLIDYFTNAMPEPTTELSYTTTYELLVAVILSAQCTDERVNKTTPAFFKKFPTLKSLAKADEEKVFPFIKSISYPNSKAKYLVGMARKVFKDFGGQIPMTVEELTTLPGVGRKTANVITSVVDKQPNMAVDTHVFRVSHRLGLVNKNANTPLAVEKELIKNFPQQLIPKAHHWLILHGRYVCKAQKPMCFECGAKDICPNYEKV